MMKTPRGLFGRLWRRVRSCLVAQVPVDSWYCEFECRKLQCRQGDWEACALSPTEADVGWWLMFDRMSFEDLGAERMEGFPTREEMIQIYEEVSGREVRDPHYWEVFGAMRFAAIMIPLSDRMVNAGLAPAELNMSVANGVTDALAKLLGIENTTPMLT